MYSLARKGQGLQGYIYINIVLPLNIPNLWSTCRDELHDASAERPE